MKIDRKPSKEVWEAVATVIMDNSSNPASAPESNSASNSTGRSGTASRSDSTRNPESNSASNASGRPEAASQTDNLSADRQQRRASQLLEMERRLFTTNRELDSLVHVLDTLRQAPEVEARAMLAELRSCENIQEFARTIRRRALVSTSSTLR